MTSELMTSELMTSELMTSEQKGNWEFRFQLCHRFFGLCPTIYYSEWHTTLHKPDTFLLAGKWTPTKMNTLEMVILISISELNDW